MKIKLFEDFSKYLKQELYGSTSIEQSFVNMLTNEIHIRWQISDEKADIIAKSLWSRAELRLLWINLPEVKSDIAEGVIHKGTIDAIISIMWTHINELTYKKLNEASEVDALKVQSKTLADQIDDMKTKYNKLSNELNKKEDVFQTNINKTSDVPVGYLDFLVMQKSQNLKKNLLNFGTQIASKINQKITIDNKIKALSDKPEDKKEEETESKVEKTPEQ